MKENKKINELQGMSDELKRAISENFLYLEYDSPDLNEQDTTILKSILKGEMKPDFRIDKKRAIFALVRNDESSETAEILEKILADKTQMRRIRKIAAFNLGKMSSLFPEELLIRHLKTEEDPLIQMELIRTLGSIGSDKALNTLNKLRSEKILVKRQIEYSKKTANIKHRIEKDQDLQLQTHAVKHPLKKKHGEAIYP